MVTDKHIRRTGEDYAAALGDLLPTGLAWPRERESLLMKVVGGLAKVFGFVDARAADLLEKEADPRFTLEILPEWERAFGLPDLCLAEPLTIEARRNALLERMTTIGAQSREFFIGVAARMGYQIGITEYAPFMAGVSQAGDTRDANGDFRWQIGAPEMRFYWTIWVRFARLSWFRATSGQAGVDPHLRIGLATDLECLMRRLKPAHTDIVFAYTNLRSGSSMSDTP